MACKKVLTDHTPDVVWYGNRPYRMSFTMKGKNVIKKGAKYRNSPFPKRNFWMTKKHMKRCSTLLLIREMPVQTTVKSVLILVRTYLWEKGTKASEEAKKRKHVELKACNLQQGLRERVMRTLHKLKTQTTYNPAIPLLSLYQRVMQSGLQKNVCMHIFIALLFTLTKAWRQTKGSSLDKSSVSCTSTHTCTHTTKSYFVIKEGSLPFGNTWINPEVFMLSEVSQRSTNTTWSHLYV